MSRRLLDLGVSDVHQPSAVHVTRPRERTMAEISTKQRKGLATSQFALPAQRKYPIHDAAHVRNAAARLAQEKKAGKISDADYATAKAAIARAEKRFGIKAAKPAGRRLHVRADLADGGSLHVSHHMTGAKVRLDGVLIELADDDKKPVWIQLAKPGVFRGHPAGPFEMNSTTFEEIVRNFKSTENRQIPVDFEHASEAPATEGSIPVLGAPAQGWIKDMKIEGGNLWGLVEWGDRAREYIKSGAYKYFSPAVRFGAKDRVTGLNVGARMTSGALTNSPYLDGLKPLAAKDGDAVQVKHNAIEMVVGPDGVARGELTVPMRGALAHSAHEYMPQMKAALRMPELSSAKECKDMVDRLRDHLEAVDGNHDAMHEGIKLGDYCKPLRDMVGATPGMTWDEVFDIVDDMIDAAMDRHELEYHAGGEPETETAASYADDPEMGAEMSDRIGLVIARAELELRARGA